MLRQSYVIAALIVAATLPLTGSCTKVPQGSGPQGKAVLPDNPLNDWRVLCSNGMVYQSVHGTYLEVLASGICSPGHIVGMWDNGLGKYGKGPPFLGAGGVVAILPRYGDLQAVGVAGELTTGLERRLRELRADGACGEAICRDSARNRYDVTYLQSDRRSRRFDCRAAGLLNERLGANGVTGRLTGVPAAQCPIGPTLRASEGASPGR